MVKSENYKELRLNDLLSKRMDEITVLEALEVSTMLFASKKPTIDVKEFCLITGNTIANLKKYMKEKTLPDHLIIGGYQNRVQKRKLLFDTDKVIEWLKTSK
jgi:hypothetical protein